MSVKPLPFELGWFALPASYGVHLPGFLWNETRAALEQVRTLFGHDAIEVRYEESDTVFAQVRYNYQMPSISSPDVLTRSRYYPEQTPMDSARSHLLKNRWVIRLPWGQWRAITNLSVKKYRVDPATGQRYYKE